MSSPSAPAESYRAAGSFRSALPTIVSTSPRSRPSTVPRRAGSSRRTASIASVMTRPSVSMGSSPASSSYAITPSAYTSARRSTAAGSPLTCSGLM